MFEQAIANIQTEMEQKQDGYTQAVGTMLLKHLKKNQHDAEKILAEDKTIAGSLKEMEKVAREKKVGNVGVLSDDEGFAVVLKYFGIEKKVAGTGFVTSLDEYMG